MTSQILQQLWTNSDAKANTFLKLASAVICGSSLDELRSTNLLTHLHSLTWLSSNFDLSRSLKDKNTITPTKLEVRYLLPLAQVDAHFCCENNGRDLSHADRQDCHISDLGVQHNATADLQKLVAWVIGRVDSLWAETVATLAGHTSDGLEGFLPVGGNDCCLEVDLALDDSCFDHFAVDWGVLSVIAVCVEEGVSENTPGELIGELAALEKVGDAPLYALDSNYGGI
jgi:hypothetical protein